jgi:lactoylglutathione lyase
VSIPYVTGHVGLNVTDLDRSTRFYSEVFDLEVQKRSDGPGHRFVFLGSDDRIVLTLWEQSAGTFRADQPGLHHLSFQVSDIDAVRQTEARLRTVGAHLFHDGVVSHAEGASSGGIFFADPDGTRLEVYAPSGVEAEPAPFGAAPTCGFF